MGTKSLLLGKAQTLQQIKFLAGPRYKSFYRAAETLGYMLTSERKLDINAFHKLFGFMVKVGTVEDWKTLIWAKPESDFAPAYNPHNPGKDYLLDYIAGTPEIFELLGEPVQREIVKENKKNNGSLTVSSHR